MRHPRRRWTTVLVTALLLAASGPAVAAGPLAADDTLAVRAAAAPASSAELGAATDESTYVTRVYRDLFHRTPDAGGLATWVAALSRGTAREAVANSITGSDEYRSRLITAVYDHYLGRAPDGSGLRFWLAQMRSGLQIEQMTAGFLASDEFFARGGSTATGWVTLLYQTVLDRSPASAEADWWVRAIATGTNRGTVARGFLYSTEHLSSVVDGYYTDLLGRHLDPSGQATWVGLIQSGHRDEEIIAAIVSSAEYRALAGQADREVRLAPAATPQTCAGGQLVGGGVTWTTPLPAGAVSVELLRSGARVASAPAQGLEPGAYTVRVRVAGGFVVTDDGAQLDPNGLYLLPVTVTPYSGTCTALPVTALGIRTTPQTCVGGNLVGGSISWPLPVPAAIESADIGLGTHYLSSAPISDLGPGTYTIRMQVTPGVQLVDPGAVDYGGGIFIVPAVVAVSSDPACRQPRPSVRVGLGPGGAAPDGNVGTIAISGDGTWVAFDSTSTTLAPGDHDAGREVFVTNTVTGETSLVSHASDGTSAGWESREPAISGDGRWVVFSSYAARLPSATGKQLVYAWDRTDGTITVVSRAADGSLPDKSAGSPTISADGRWVAFRSWATNLVADDTNGHEDFFVVDRQTGAVTRLPTPAGAYGTPNISPDGGWLVVTEQTSTAPYLTAALWDVQTGTRRTLLTGADSAIASYGGQVGQDGRWATFTAEARRLVPGSTNMQQTTFLWDAATGQHAPAALGLSGGPSNSQSEPRGISADGTRVVYFSDSTDIPGGSRNGGPDAAWYDTTTGRTTLVAAGPGGVAPNAGAYYPVMSADGHVIAYTSDATNLVLGGTGGLTELYVTRID